MVFPSTYRQQLIDAGEVELIVVDDETIAAVNLMIDSVIDAYPEKRVIAQRRQNNPQDQRFIFTDAEGSARIWNQPHPWQAELDIIDAVYEQLIDGAEKIGGELGPLAQLIDEMHARYVVALAGRPHPDNPYVNMWMSGGPAGD